MTSCRYRSPDVLCGNTFYSNDIDVWSLGCIFAELGVGVPLLRGKSTASQAEKMFAILGHPCQHNYPEIEQLPGYPEVCVVDTVHFLLRCQFPTLPPRSQMLHFMCADCKEGHCADDSQRLPFRASGPQLCQHSRSSGLASFYAGVPSTKAHQLCKSFAAPFLPIRSPRVPMNRGSQWHPCIAWR